MPKNDQQDDEEDVPAFTFGKVKVHGSPRKSPIDNSPIKINDSSDKQQNEGKEAEEGPESLILQSSNKVQPAPKIEKKE